MNPFFYSSTPHVPEPISLSSNSPQFLIRGARPTDLLSLAEVLADSFHSRAGYQSWFYPVLRMGIYEDLRHRLRSSSPHYLCLVATLPSKNPATENWSNLVGTVEVALRSHQPWVLGGVQYPYLSNLAVRSEWRRQGVAKQLLTACEQTVRNWGFQEIYLHVLEDNYQACNLYFNMGYNLHRIDSSWTSWLLRHPQRSFFT